MSAARIVEGVDLFEEGDFDFSSGLPRLCRTNPVRDSSPEFSVIAGGREQTEHTDLQDVELARV
jgi:hypothetical protein